MEKQRIYEPVSFTLSTESLHFSFEESNLKLNVKNTSLKTTSYEIIITDQQHFKIVSARSFSLAPGIHKQITIKHVCGNHCGIVERQILQARIRDSNNKWVGFECRCPSYEPKKYKELIEYQKKIQLGEFDQKITFEVEFKNISQKNLKIIFLDRLQVKNNASQTNIFIIDAEKKLTIRNLNNDTIVLANQELVFQFQLIMGQHGQLKQRLDFIVVVEEMSSKFTKNRQVVSSAMKEDTHKYFIDLRGYSVSKKLIIKDQSAHQVSEIRNQLLTGTSKSSYFYIQTQYHQDMPYTLEAYFETDTPELYADKWKNITIQFIDCSPSSSNEQKTLNSCSGILKTKCINKIQYKISTNYTVNDSNYVAKYSKIQFEDDSNALRMRNSEYSKKYQDLQVKVKIRFEEENRTCKSVKTIIKNSKKNYNYLQTIIPFKFTLINPSLRCQVSEQMENSQSTNIVIFNQTKINIPYSFPKHSLYRIVSNNNSNQNINTTLQVNKKQCLAIKWVKPNQRCPIFMEIPSFDLVLFEPRESELKQKNIICLPPSRRRPQTSISSAIKAKEKQTNVKNQQYGIINRDLLQRMSSQPTFVASVHNNILSRPSSVYQLRPNTSKTCRISHTKRPNTPQNYSSAKKPIIFKQFPYVLLNKNKNMQIPQIDQLNFLMQIQKMLKNTHPTFTFVLEIMEFGYLILHPGQYFVFDGPVMEELVNNFDGINGGLCLSGVIRYKIYGHSPVYRIKISDEIDHFQEEAKNTKDKEKEKQKQKSIKIMSLNQIPNMFQSQPYQIISRQARMSFKQSKQEFEIIQPILIKNCSNSQIQVNCISIDGQFFKCKQPNSLIMIDPEEVGKFKIGFQPENTVRLSVLNKQPPKQLRRKAMIKSDQEMTTKQSITMVKKQIKLLINKKVQTIICIGQIIQKSCSIRPYQVSLTNCKYGSPQIIQTMIITNTSSHKINFIIQNPNQISIKPKTGSIMPKCTQNCTISFKPCKKISNFQDNIKIYIGGSHLELVPLHINVADPQIFIKQKQLIPNQNAICGTQIQELNLEMTIINNNPSQSFIEINMKNTPLYLGYTKNYHSPNSGLVMQNFIRCSQIIQSTKQPATYKNITRLTNNSLMSITSEGNISQCDNTASQQIQKQRMDQVCSITVVPNSFLIVPLTLRVHDAKMGSNTIKIQKNIATLVGFGQIKSPSVIKFNCNKTLLHITPLKNFSQIILTQHQKNYQINLKNLSDKIIRIQTQIKQVHKPTKTIHIENLQEGIHEDRTSEIQPSIICTFKDINEYLKPEASIDLNMSFICFQAEKQKINAEYELAIFVQEEEQLQLEKQSSISVRSAPYFTTTINVIVPEPFLQIVPAVLVMPTVGVNVWSRQSFVIRNNGFKQIFVKIKKPTNIVFEMECLIMNGGSTTRNKSKDRLSNFSSDQKSKDPQKTTQNQLTKINNVLQVRISWRSKTKISFKCILQIEDNFNKNYQMAIVGTCTDSPFFVLDGDNMLIPNDQIQSQKSFCSSKSFNSSSSLKSSRFGNNSVLKKSNLEPTDIEDLLFLNNWIGSLIPEISNESTFFYVWLTKIDNFIKFLNEFNVTLGSKKQPIQFNSQKQKTESKQKFLQKLSLTSVFQELKLQGFQLNSLRIDLLQKADQLQWLNFMWFFLSKSVICQNFIPWLSKNTTIRQTQQINYKYVQKNFQQLITILMTTILDLKKQQNNNKSIDWNYLLQNFQPLLQNFSHVESRRHLILSLNLMYHKLKNIQKEIIQISDFQFVLNIHNTHNRRVRYYLQCNTKFITCQQSSNKVLPTETPHGYSFVAQQKQQFTITFSLRNYVVNTLTVITKNILDIADITMYNNIIWDPITILHLQLKRKEDILHHVYIQCENKSSQQWVYKFQSKISAEYRIFFDLQDQSGFQSMKLLTGQPGFLKKGESITIRVIYSPENMSKCEGVLRIVNTMVKEVFKIHGKPIHSSKIQNQKNIKIVQKETHIQSITIPWQILTPKNTRNPTQHNKNNSLGQTQSKNLASSSSRKQISQNQGQQKQKDPSQPTFNIKLYSPQNPSVQPKNKYIQCLLSKAFDYNSVKKQVTITLTFKYQILIRNLELIFQVIDRDNIESKLIRFVVDVIPKPILIQAEIESQYNVAVVQSLKIPNLTKIGQSVTVQYGYVQPLIPTGEADKKQPTQNKSTDKKLQFSINAASSILQNIHKGLFQVLKVKNNDNINFSVKSNQNQKILDFIDIKVRYHPNQNNCYFSDNPIESDNQSYRPKLQNLSVTQTKSKILSRNNSNLNENQDKQNNNMDINFSKTTQLPYFYITANYTQSLYQITYLFKPSIKKTINKINCLLPDKKKDIYHECIPLKKYTHNHIQIDNTNSKIQAVFEVQTDLYEISGNNQIVVPARALGKYYYDVYCLHLGRKQGKIKFKELAGQRDGDSCVLEFNVVINISEANPAHNLNGKVQEPKSSRQELRIYNENFEIKSPIRKSKVFSISLANLSEKQIQYQVRCNSEYLHPRISSSGSSPPLIKIPKSSQYELQIDYIPYFLGKKQAKLNLYNPHQPQISYHITMISQENIETVVKEMNRIGQNKPIQIAVENPIGALRKNLVNDGSTLKNKLKNNEDVEIELELVDLSINKNKVNAQDYGKYMKIIQQSTNIDINPSDKYTNPQQNLQKNPYKLILKFPQTSQHSQIKHTNKKFYIYFLTESFLPEYHYQLVFNSQKYGQYKYNITYKYPNMQKMQQKIIFVEEKKQFQCNNFNKENKDNNSMIKVLRNNKKKQNRLNTQDIEVSIPFSNKFNEQLQLCLKCTQNIHSVKLLNQEKNSQKQTNGNSITIPPFTKQQIYFKFTYNQIKIRKGGKQDSEFFIEVQSVKNQQFVWLYPITIYRVCRTSQRVPVFVSGQARQPLYVKIHPLIAYRASKIEMFMCMNDKGDENKEKQILKSGQQMQIQLRLKQDVIKKRIIKKIKTEQTVYGQAELTERNSIKASSPPALNSPKQIILSDDRLIPQHLYLNSEYIYEIEVTINTLSAIKGQGYFYIYQTASHVESKNLTPAVSEKNMFRNSDDQLNNGQDRFANTKNFQNLGYFVEKIPFSLKIDSPKTQVLEFQANVGEKATIKLKVENLNNRMGGGASTKSVPKAMDYIEGAMKNEVKIELHNNKCREFSAFYNEPDSCIDVTYFAKEYSGLKKGRLEINVGGVYSQYELMGKFPKNERNQKDRQKFSKRTSRAN